MDNAEPDDEFVIDEYGKILYELYPDRCLKVLSISADKRAKESNDRRHYRYLAITLKKIAMHPGGNELASELVAKYRA